MTCQGRGSFARNWPEENQHSEQDYHSAGDCKGGARPMATRTLLPHHVQYGGAIRPEFQFGGGYHVVQQAMKIVGISIHKVEERSWAAIKSRRRWRARAIRPSTARAESASGAPMESSDSPQK